MSILEEVLKANEDYVASFGSRGELGIPIYGYIYEVDTGRLVEVPDATTAGAAT